MTTNVVVNRVLDVPASKAWEAWTESSRVKQWWGPAGWTAPVAQMDVRVGGTSLVCMRSPEGHEIYNTWTYQELGDGRTEMTVTEFGYTSEETAAMSKMGMEQCIDKMAASF